MPLSSSSPSPPSSSPSSALDALKKITESEWRCPCRENARPKYAFGFEVVEMVPRWYKGCLGGIEFV